jgi:hypothetical protein
LKKGRCDSKFFCHLKFYQQMFQTHQLAERCFNVQNFRRKLRNHFKTKTSNPTKAHLTPQNP